MSRINQQNSRMTMSAKIPPNPNQPQVLNPKIIPPNVGHPAYLMGDPKVIQAGSQNAFNQPVIVASNMPYHPGITSLNAPPVYSMPSPHMINPQQFPQGFPTSHPQSGPNTNNYPQNLPT